MSEAGPAVTRFAFANGDLRGTHLTLYPTSLVHRSDTHLETVPLAAVSAVRVAFERDARKLGWGVTLIVFALLLLAIAGPLGSWASHAVSTGQQPIPAMQVVFRMVEVVASALPVVALACVIAGGALCAFGWLGTTTLAVSLPGSERVYPVRGRDTALLDFAEALSERLTAARR